jgi:hypothetical protein
MESIGWSIRRTSGWAAGHIADEARLGGRAYSRRVGVDLSDQRPKKLRI